MKNLLFIRINIHHFSEILYITTKHYIFILKSIFN